jgi:L,D-transpeptidase YcbB
MKAAYLLLLLTVLTACQSQPVNTKGTIRDTTITAGNSFSELFLDSLQLEKFILATELKNIGAARLRNFYNSRNYSLHGLQKMDWQSKHVPLSTFHNSYIKLANDSLMSDIHLHEQMNELRNEGTVISAVSNTLIATELQLTEHFFKFAQHAYAGRINPKELQWHIPRKKVDVLALLDTLIANKGQKAEQWMNKELIRYADIKKNGG